MIRVLSLEQLKTASRPSTKSSWSSCSKAIALAISVRLARGDTLVVEQGVILSPHYAELLGVSVNFVLPAFQALSTRISTFIALITQPCAANFTGLIAR